GLRSARRRRTALGPNGVTGLLLDPDHVRLVGAADADLLVRFGDVGDGRDPVDQQRVYAGPDEPRVDLANLAPDRQPIASGRAGHLDRLGAVADRRDELHVSSSRRTSRGWGPAVRGEPMIKLPVPGSVILRGWPDTGATRRRFTCRSEIGRAHV